MSDISNDTQVAEQITREIKRIGSETNTQIKNLSDSFQRDLEAARALATEGKDYTDAQLKAFSESAVAKYAELEAATKKRVEDAADDFKAALNRRLALAGGTPADEAKAKADTIEFKRVKAAIRNELRPDQVFEASEDEIKDFQDYTRVFSGPYLRKNERTLNDIETRALSTGSDPDGGYMVPPALSNRIITKIWETSPLRQLATVENIGTDRLELPVDIDDVGFGWVGEEELRPETTTPTLGTQTILLSEQYAKPKITQRLLEDAAMDVVGWLINKISDRFARAEATAFIRGTGVKQPRGLITYPDGSGRGLVPQIPSGNGTALTDTALVTLPFQLKEFYLGNARFLMKRSTLAAIAVFKDSNGQYLWAPGLREGVGQNLVGYPISFADDMPSVAAGALPIAFGDFRRAYTVIDRLGMTTLRDPYSSKPFVEYYTRRRVGGDVVEFDAFVTMKVSA